MACLEGVGALNALDRGEGPAGAAGALVLDVADDVLRAVVELVVGSEVGLDSLPAEADLRLEAEERCVLSAGETGELVHGELEVGGFVVLLDEAGVREPDAEAELVLVTGVVAVGGTHPRDEGFLLVSVVENAKCEGSKKRKHKMTSDFKSKIV